MTKRDLYFSLHCELVEIPGGHAVARVTLVNWELEVVLDTFVQVPVPVTNFPHSGISPKDIHTSNTNAMSFCDVRQRVQEMLRGKILIGHGLVQHLNALGLTHPFCDMRDTARYFQDPETGSSGRLGQLAMEFLDHRQLPEVSTKERPIKSCIAALDLYKTRRQEWEQTLIQAQRQQQQPPEQPSRDQTFAPPPAAAFYQQQQQQPSPPSPPILPQQRPRISSYDGYPPSSLMMQQGFSAPPHQHAMHPTQESNSNSPWFILGGHKVPPNSIPPMSQAAPALLSPQAMQALTSQYDHYDSSTTYENSTTYAGSYYDASTDYGSTAYDYDSSSVVSESIATESIANSLHNEQQDLETEEPSPQRRQQQQQRPQQQQQQRESSSSSWRWFGSRSSKSQREPMMSVSEEVPEETRPRPVTPATEFVTPPAEEAMEEEQPPAASVMTSAPTEYEPPKYFCSKDGSSTKHSSKWFGFRRSKSPSSTKRDGKNSENEENDTDDALERTHHSAPLPELKEVEKTLSDVPEQEQVQQQTSEKTTNEKHNSYWFRLGRRSNRQGSNDQDDEMVVPSIEQNTMESSANDPAAANSDEDWLREVMKQPEETDEFLLESYHRQHELEVVLVNDHPVIVSGEETATIFRGEEEEEEPREEAEPMKESVESKSSSWFFRGRRSKRRGSNSHDATKAIGDVAKSAEATNDNANDWLQEMMIPDNNNENLLGSYLVDKDPSNHGGEAEEDQKNDPTSINDDSSTKEQGRQPPKLFSSSEQQQGGKHNSSWFRLGRRSNNHKRRSSNFVQELSIEQTTQPTESNGEDDDWLQEVMSQPGNNDDLLGPFRHNVIAEDDELKQVDASEGATSKPQDDGDSEDSQLSSSIHTADDESSNRQNQSTWFRFLRSSKSSSRNVSRLPSAASQDDEEEELTSDDIRYSSSFEESLHSLPPSAPSIDVEVNNRSANGSWLEEVVTSVQPIDSSCLGPAWFGFSTHQEALDGPSPALNDLSFLRARLCTESTIPTVATEAEEDFDDSFSQDYLLQGMEHNFSFLNI